MTSKLSFFLTNRYYTFQFLGHQMTSDTLLNCSDTVRFVFLFAPWQLLRGQLGILRNLVCQIGILNIEEVKN